MRIWWFTRAGILTNKGWTFIIGRVRWTATLTKGFQKPYKRRVRRHDLRVLNGKPPKSVILIWKNDILLLCTVRRKRGTWRQNLEMESNSKISKAMKATRLKESSHDAFALSFHRFGCNPPIRNRKVSCHRPYFLILVCLVWPSDLNDGFTVGFCAKTPIGFFGNFWFFLVIFF